MSNPFDDADSPFLVLANDEGRYSLWPAFLDVPAGWRVAHDAASRDEARAFVDAHWLDCGRAPRTAIAR
jgi:MbtH protein